jgi:phosphatidylglycerophosphatase A
VTLRAKGAATAEPDLRSDRFHVSRALRLGATLGPVGYVPLAPGTAGSVVALAAWLALPHGAGWTLGVLGPLAVFAVCAAGEVARAREVADPPEVVIDEAIGMLCALALAPAGRAAAALTFVAFRAFDIVKPYPVRRLERLPGGWGIVADDVAAGLWAAAAVRLTWYFLG